MSGDNNSGGYMIGFVYFIAFCMAGDAVNTLHRIADALEKLTK